VFDSCQLQGLRANRGPKNHMTFEGSLRFRSTIFVIFPLHQLYHQPPKHGATTSPPPLSLPLYPPRTALPPSHRPTISPPLTHPRLLHRAPTRPISRIQFTSAPAGRAIHPICQGTTKLHHPTRALQPRHDNGRRRSHKTDCEKSRDELAN
jgi:hypothetical protein